MQLPFPLLVSLALAALAWSGSAQAAPSRAAAPQASPAASPPATRPASDHAVTRGLIGPKPAPRRIVVPEKRPVSFGSVARTKLLAQMRSRNGDVHYGSVERRAAIEGKRVQGSRQAPKRRRP